MKKITKSYLELDNDENNIKYYLLLIYLYFLFVYKNKKLGIFMIVLIKKKLEKFLKQKNLWMILLIKIKWRKIKKNY